MTDSGFTIADMIPQQQRDALEAVRAMLEADEA
jgi:hypothetical protein